MNDRFSTLTCENDLRFPDRSITDHVWKRFPRSGGKDGSDGTMMSCPSCDQLLSLFLSLPLPHSCYCCLPSSHFYLSWPYSLSSGFLGKIYSEELATDFLEAEKVWLDQSHPMGFHSWGGTQALFSQSPSPMLKALHPLALSHISQVPFHFQHHASLIYVQHPFFFLSQNKHKIIPPPGKLAIWH